jgi:hypothetical protein
VLKGAPKFGRPKLSLCSELELNPIYFLLCNRCKFFSKKHRLFSPLTYPTEMIGYSSHIENVETGAAVWTVSEHVHGTSFHVEGFWVNNVTSHSDMKLVIEAEIDHDGTTTTKEVSFHCHPM